MNCICCPGCAAVDLRCTARPCPGVGSKKLERQQRQYSREKIIQIDNQAKKYASCGTHGDMIRLRLLCHNRCLRRFHIGRCWIFLPWYVIARCILVVYAQWTYFSQALVWPREVTLGMVLHSLETLADPPSAPPHEVSIENMSNILCLQA